MQLISLAGMANWQLVGAIGAPILGGRLSGFMISEATAAWYEVRAHSTHILYNRYIISTEAKLTPKLCSQGRVSSSRLRSTLSYILPPPPGSSVRGISLLALTAGCWLYQEQLERQAHLLWSCHTVHDPSTPCLHARKLCLDSEVCVGSRVCCRTPLSSALWKLLSILSFNTAIQHLTIIPPERTPRESKNEYQHSLCLRM